MDTKRDTSSRDRICRKFTRLTHVKIAPHVKFMNYSYGVKVTQKSLDWH